MRLIFPISGNWIYLVALPVNLHAGFFSLDWHASPDIGT